MRYRLYKILFVVHVLVLLLPYEILHCISDDIYQRSDILDLPPALMFGGMPQRVKLACGKADDGPIFLN